MNSRLNSRVFILVIFFFFFSRISAQTFDVVLNKLHTQYREEKLHLHFDKEVYYPGETIWFKAYLFAGSYPSEISKILYADLLDSSGGILQHKILPVIQSSSSGALIVPNDMNGPVIIRCYTKWMLNFDSTLLFEKAFQISNAYRTNGNFATQEPVSALFSLDFFPEGGQLIEDIESRVAFKASDQYGYPISVTGTIRNNRDTTTINFQSIHDGMGYLMIRPLKNVSYRATARIGDKTTESLLPIPKKTGLVLETNNIENGILYTIKCADTTPISPFVYVIAQMNQQLIYRARVNIAKNEVVSGKISTLGIPSGVVQVTVFTSEEKPIAERLVFSNLASITFPVTAKTTNLDLDARKKNTLEIEVPDSISSNLSISITSNSPTPIPVSENIYTRVLLNADIRGYIHDPSYYFSNADSASYHLDLVMMTHGWRRFKWDDVLNGTFPEIKFTPEKSIVVDGEIKGLKPKELWGKELIGLVELYSGKKHFLSTPIDPAGKFEFDNLTFYDSAKLFYQFSNDKKDALRKLSTFKTANQVLELGPKIPLQMPLFRQLRSVIVANNPGLQLYEKSQKWNDSVNAKVLKGVTVKTRILSKEDSLNAEYTSGPFEEHYHSRIITPDEDPAFLASPSLFDYLQGRVSGLQINPNADEDPIIWRGFPTSLFVNEISQQVLSPTTLKLVEDATLIRSLMMSDIAMVKIFNPPFVGAWGNGPGGCIAIYLKKTGGQKSNVQKEFIKIYGFSATKEFYSPDYAIDSNRLEPDFRSTLYWNPYVITDRNNRKIQCSFYTNDSPGKLIAVIEGCNEEGKLIRIVKILN